MKNFLVNLGAYVYVLFWTGLILGVLLVVPVTILNLFGIELDREIMMILGYILYSTPLIALVVCFIFRKKVFSKV